MIRSKRFQKREERAVNRDTFVQEEAALGLTVMDSPNDPKPSLRLEET
jgi:propanediol dehydratase large subunit